MEKSAAAIEAVCGVRPKGFRSPEGELTLDTLRIARGLGMEYSSNLSDDDRPYMKELGDGEALLEIPIHWVNYDLPYFAFNYHPAFPAGQGRIANYTGVLSNWKDEFDGCPGIRSVLRAAAGSCRHRRAGEDRTAGRAAGPHEAERGRMVCHWQRNGGLLYKVKDQIIAGILCTTIGKYAKVRYNKNACPFTSAVSSSPLAADQAEWTEQARQLDKNRLNR